MYEISMSLFVRLCVQIHVSTCACKNQRSASGVVPQGPSSHVAWDLPNRLGLLANKSQECSCLCLPKAEFTSAYCLPCLAFYMDSGDQTQVLVD